MAVNEVKKKVIVIAGPTASGKTAAAIRFAQHFKTEIISADSRQCFSELNIGVARPSMEELKAVNHHFIASHSIHEEITAAWYEQYALDKAKELFQTHDIIIMAGGTGLYIKAFCEGLDEIPAIDSSVRLSIINNYTEKGLSWLQQEVEHKDPDFYKVGEIKNPQRLMRALEVIESTGHSVLHYRKGRKANRVFDIIKIGLELPKEQLHDNIINRTHKMIEAGLVGEVKTLIPFRKLNALQTVGYAEIFEYLDGNISLDNAVERIIINTRQYAKRQMTWFRKDPSIKWFAPSEMERAIHFASTT